MDRTSVPSIGNLPRLTHAMFCLARLGPAGPALSLASLEILVVDATEVDNARDEQPSFTDGVDSAQAHLLLPSSPTYCTCLAHLAQAQCKEFLLHRSNCSHPILHSTAAYARPLFMANEAAVIR